MCRNFCLLFQGPKWWSSWAWVLLGIDCQSNSRCPFHQRFTCKFFLYKWYFSSFFSSYMYIVKATETTFVQKTRAYNVDEIDGRSSQGMWSSRLLAQPLLGYHCIIRLQLGQENRSWRILKLSANNIKHISYFFMNIL